MIAYLALHWPAVVIATLCALASASVGFSEILHSPDMPNYRQASWTVRMSMMAWSITLAGRAATITSGLAHGAPETFDWSAVLATTAMAIYHGALLWDTASKRLPARIWRRLDRLLYLASCGRHSSALTELTLAGAMVVAPGEHSLPPRPL